MISLIDNLLENWRENSNNMTSPSNNQTYENFVNSTKSQTDQNELFALINNINNTIHIQKSKRSTYQDAREERHAQDTSNLLSGEQLLSILVNIDQSLINVQNSFRENTQENSTLIQFMKDFDYGLSRLNNDSTVILQGLDNIDVDIDLVDLLSQDNKNDSKRIENESDANEDTSIVSVMKLFDKIAGNFAHDYDNDTSETENNIKRSKRSTDQGHTKESSKKYFVLNLMKVIVPFFKNSNIQRSKRSTDQEHSDEETSRQNPVINLMKAIVNNNSNMMKSKSFTNENNLEETSRQNAVLHLMKAVDQSIVDVRQFLSKAEEIEKEQEQVEDTPIVSVMKLVDQGLVKLRGTFANDTDTSDTETAIGSLSNVINRGLNMVEKVLNQTTVYAVGEVQNNSSSFTEFVDEVKNYYFENETGQVTLPQDEINQDNSFVTILKLADQEMLDIFR